MEPVVTVSERVICKLGLGRSLGRSLGLQFHSLIAQFGSKTLNPSLRKSAISLAESGSMPFILFPG